MLTGRTSERALTGSTNRENDSQPPSSRCQVDPVSAQM
jgi:hypothetical protein